MTKFLPALLFLTCLITPQANAGFGVICDGDDVRNSVLEVNSEAHIANSKADGSRAVYVCAFIAKNTRTTDTKESDSISLFDQLSNFVVELSR